jgi:hypothetical protein
MATRFAREMAVLRRVRRIVVLPASELLHAAGLICAGPSPPILLFALVTLGMLPTNSASHE